MSLTTTKQEEEEEFHLSLQSGRFFLIYMFNIYF